MSLFTLDFGGCGMSEGEFISLGWWEREDLQSAIGHLRGLDGRVSTIGLWGRSMGAVTALLHGDRDPSIGSIVVDSPFSSLRTLASELVDQMNFSVPGFAVGAAISIIRGTVRLPPRRFTPAHAGRHGPGGGRGLAGRFGRRPASPSTTSRPLTTPTAASSPRCSLRPTVQAGLLASWHPCASHLCSDWGTHAPADAERPAGVDPAR
jgi:hypothetical protein